jgi:hypothetical protein
LAGGRPQCPPMFKRNYATGEGGNLLDDGIDRYHRIRRREVQARL